MKPELIDTEYVREVISTGMVPMLDIKLAPAKRKYLKVGRNELCPCGSGIKHKKCRCGKKFKADKLHTGH